MDGIYTIYAILFEKSNRVPYHLSFMLAEVTVLSQLTYRCFAIVCAREEKKGARFDGPLVVWLLRAGRFCLLMLFVHNCGNNTTLLPHRMHGVVWQRKRYD